MIIFVGLMKFFSDISIWWLLPWAIVSVFVSIWFYRNQKQLSDVSALRKKFLLTLRAFSVFILGLLFLGILIERKEYKLEPPLFITMIDNSTSMLNYKDSSVVLKKIDELNNRLKSDFGDRFELINYTIGRDIGSGKTDFKEYVSNLEAGFEFIYSRYYNRNVGGICFISDGNFTEGRSPVYSAEKISMTPVFSVVVGDSVVKRDQLIRNVAVNDVAFFKNQFPVEIDIEARKIGKQGSEVAIYKNGKKIASEKIEYKDEHLSFEHITLLLTADEIGFINYMVKISPLDKESSYENNTRSFYVEVIDSRNKVLIVAKAPHPDISAVKQMIEEDDNIEVKVVLHSDWEGSLKDYQLLIWHEPGVISNRKLIDEINATQTPVFYMIGNQSNSASIVDLGIGFNIPAGKRFDEVQGYFQDGFQLFEISDELKKMMKSWPPLDIHFGNYDQNVPNLLIGQRVGNVLKKEPLLYFGSKGKRKYGVLNGEGIWRWKMQEYATKKETTVFKELIQKSIQYLVIKENTESLRVKLPNKFNAHDEIILNAEFYNASMERIIKPSISLQLKSENDKILNFQFAKKTSDYTLSVGKLKPGKYSWKAETTYDGKKYSKSGVFVVEDISVEALSTHADFNVMQQLASKTNGTFYTLSDIDQLLKDIADRKDIVTVSYEETSFKDLIDLKWLFFLLAISLIGEWFLRRYSGTY